MTDDKGTSDGQNGDEDHEEEEVVVELLNAKFNFVDLAGQLIFPLQRTGPHSSHR